MRSIKTYKSFVKDINQFIDLVREETYQKVGTLYDMFQDHQDDGYEMDIIIGLIGPDYEEGHNIDIIDLFSIDRDLNISDSIVDDGSRSGYVNWIIKNDFDLILEDVVFTICFSMRNLGEEWCSFYNVLDGFIPKMNSMFDYVYIDHGDFSFDSTSGVRLKCQL